MLLYHYTDTAGLIGILISKTLWTTDAKYLNDAQELRHSGPPMAMPSLTATTSYAKTLIPEVELLRRTADVMAEVGVDQRLRVGVAGSPSR